MQDERPGRRGTFWTHVVVLVVNSKRCALLSPLDQGLDERRYCCQGQEFGGHTRLAEDTSSSICV